MHKMIMSNLFDLHDEVAVVIGGAGALGGALAEGMAEAGAKVAILDLNPAPGLARAEKINQAGGIARFFAVNALERESLHQAHLEIEKTLGVPTVLVNAAGGNSPKATISPENLFGQLALEDWRRNFDLNLIAGALLPCQEFGSAMAARGKGSIINFASVSAHIPLSKVVAYSSAKAAVLSLSRFLAREWAKQGVRVNTLTPGFFPADQNRALLFHADGTPTERTQSIWNHTPMGRFGDSKELVGAAIFLASSRASSFVTGSDIRVDGGFLSQTI